MSAYEEEGKLVIASDKFYISTQCFGNIRTYGDLKKNWNEGGLMEKQFYLSKITTKQTKNKQTTATVKAIFINNPGWVLKVHEPQKHLHHHINIILVFI